jgi:hypothetical protein
LPGKLNKYDLYNFLHTLDPWFHLTEAFPVQSTILPGRALPLVYKLSLILSAICMDDPSTQQQFVELIASISRAIFLFLIRLFRMRL